METAFIIVSLILLGAILGCLIWVIVAVKDILFELNLLDESVSSMRREIVHDYERYVYKVCEEEKRYAELLDSIARCCNYIRLLQAECERK